MGLLDWLKRRRPEDPMKSPDYLSPPHIAPRCPMCGYSTKWIVQPDGTRICRCQLPKE